MGLVDEVPKKAWEWKISFLEETFESFEKPTTNASTIAYDDSVKKICKLRHIRLI
jgi:hypothetical protein